MNKDSLHHSWKRLPHPIRWIIVGSIGGLLLAIGLFFLVFPGPGIPFIIAGFAVLASEFAWAQIVLSRIKEKSSEITKLAKDSLKSRKKKSD